MKLPSFSVLEKEQRAVYFEDLDESLLVVGPPGSGKTSMALWRARRLATMIPPKRVVLVTRNRLLAAVASRLALEEGGCPIESMTMHKFFTTEYSGRFGHFAPTAGFQFRWPQILATYEHANVRPALDHLVVDEGQNLPPQFFIWARRFGARAVSVFADEFQTTDDDGSQVADLKAAGFTNVKPLLINYRNTQEIVDFVSQFHVDRRLPKPPASRGSSGERPRLLVMQTWADLVQAVSTRLANRGGSIGVIVYERNEVLFLAGLFKKALGAVRVDHYVSKLPAGAEHAIRMQEEGVTIISGESATGLEFDAVFLQDLSRSLPSTAALQKRRLYTFSARARDSLFLVNGPVALSAAQLADLPSRPLMEP